MNSHISVDSFHLKKTSALEPLSTCSPAFSEGAPEVPLFNTTMLSAIVNVCVLTTVWVPDIVTFPWNTASALNVLAPPTVCVPEVLTTVLSTANDLEAAIVPPPERPSPAVNVTPEWAMCSSATKPLKSSWTIALSFELIAPELILIPVPALICALTSAALGPVSYTHLTLPTIYSV